MSVAADASEERVRLHNLTCQGFASAGASSLLRASAARAATGTRFSDATRIARARSRSIRDLSTSYSTPSGSAPAVSVAATSSDID